MRPSTMHPLSLALVLACACSVSTHETEPSRLGTARSSRELLAVIDEPGPITLESVNAADWMVDRSGLINLEHPRAKAAGLKEGDEPIQIYFHALRHPTQGLFIVDTGVEKALRDDPEQSALGGIVRKFMHMERLRVHAPLAEWLAQQLAQQKESLQGVLLTHMHLDHVSGLPDVANTVPVYSGPGETSARSALHAFVQGSTDRTLLGKPPVREWAFSPDASGRFAGVLDVFGDGSLWAIWVPGHTPGSTAYLVRTPEGSVLLTGDTCHTRWGWDNGVEPGAFTADKAENANSLERLRKLAREHPKLVVRVGHQP